RDHLQPGDVLVMDELKDTNRIEFFDHYVASAGQSGYVRRAPAIHMKKRHRVKTHLVVAGTEGERGVEGVQVKIAVREHDALGMSGSAAGVEEFGHGVFIDVAVIDYVRLRRSQNLVVVAGMSPGGLSTRLVG